MTEVYKENPDAVPTGLTDCGISFLTSFWREKYFQEYICIRR